MKEPKAVIPITMLLPQNKMIKTITERFLSVKSPIIGGWFPTLRPSI
ncbi:MAG: hypothetical protein ACFFAJ_14415 [Candidatus Hodarchaeota archaeon]